MQSEKVPFWDLHRYNVADLSPRVFYDPNHANQKPITLTIMGLGVPKFPNVGGNEDVVKSTKRTKGSLFYKFDIVSSNNKENPHLVKEIIRHYIINGGLPANEPKVSNWKMKQTIPWLKNNPPAETESDLILEFWNCLKMNKKNHYLDHSGSTKVIILRHVRHIG